MQEAASCNVTKGCIARSEKVCTGRNKVLEPATGTCLPIEIAVKPYIESHAQNSYEEIVGYVGWAGLRN